MIQTVVLDLDGTIFDCSHRQHLAQAKLWDEFHSQCLGDKLHMDVVTLIRLVHFNGNFQILAVTGRNEKFRNLTNEQLIKNGILVDDILMRPDGNFDHDAEMKIELLEKYFGSKEDVLKNVIFCLDDRDGVIEKFRNYGLKAWQVRQGAF